MPWYRAIVPLSISEEPTTYRFSQEIENESTMRKFAGSAPGRWRFTSRGGSLITKAQAEKDALAAVGGGTVTLAVLDSNLGKTTWSVDITGRANEYEVWVDAHTGAILKVITRPLARRGPTRQVVQPSLPS